jgi:hypothetical protein
MRSCCKQAGPPREGEPSGRFPSALNPRTENAGVNKLVTPPETSMGDTKGFSRRSATPRGNGKQAQRPSTRPVEERERPCRLGATPTRRRALGRPEAAQRCLEPATGGTTRIHLSQLCQIQEVIARVLPRDVPRLSPPKGVLSTKAKAALKVSTAFANSGRALSERPPGPIYPARAQAVAGAATNSANLAKEAGSLTARSANTLRSSSIELSFSAWMKRE